MDLRFERITRGYYNLKEVKKLYLTAFPPSERMPFWFMMLRTKKDMVDFLGVYDGSKFVGMVYIMKRKDLIYIQYFAINGKHRSEGYGSKVLTALKERYKGGRIILEIEEVTPDAENYDQRLRRKAFYEKNGFFEKNILLIEGKNVYEFYSPDSFTIEEYNQLVKEFRGSFLYLLTKPTVKAG